MRLIKLCTTEMHYLLSVCLSNMTNGNTLPQFDQVRRIVMAHSNMAYDANSPSATLSVAKMCNQILASEVHAVEHYNGDGSLHHVSYTWVDELMANSDPIDAVGPEPMDADVASQLADETLFLSYPKEELESKFLVDPSPCERAAFCLRKRTTNLFV